MPAFRDPRSPVYDMPEEEARRLAEEYRRLLFEKGDREAAAQLLEKVRQRALEEGARMFEAPPAEQSAPPETIRYSAPELTALTTEVPQAKPSPTPRPVRYSVPELTALTTRPAVPGRTPVRYSMPEKTSEAVPIVPVVVPRPASTQRPRPQPAPRRSSEQMLREARTSKRRGTIAVQYPSEAARMTAAQPTQRPSQPGLSLWNIGGPAMGLGITLATAWQILQSLFRPAIARGRP